MLREELASVVGRTTRLSEKQEEELLEMEMRFDALGKVADRDLARANARSAEARQALEEALLAVSERHRENQALLAQLKALRREAEAVANDRDSARGETAKLKEERADAVRQRDAQQLLAHSLAAELGELRMQQQQQNLQQQQQLLSSQRGSLNMTSLQSETDARVNALQSGLMHAQADKEALAASLQRVEADKDAMAESMKGLREDFLRVTEALGVAEAGREGLRRSMASLSGRAPQGEGDRRALEKALDESDLAEAALAGERLDLEAAYGETHLELQALKAGASTY